MISKSEIFFLSKNSLHRLLPYNHYGESSDSERFCQSISGHRACSVEILISHYLCCPPVPSNLGKLPFFSVSNRQHGPWSWRPRQRQDTSAALGTQSKGWADDTFRTLQNNQWTSTFLTWALTYFELQYASCDIPRRDADVLNLSGTIETSPDLFALHILI